LPNRLESYYGGFKARPFAWCLAERGSKGKAISGLEMALDDRRVAIFHSGTRRSGDKLLTDGGRALGVTAVADDLPSAVMSAYEAVNKIHFDGMQFRHDIGAKGLK
jgi:phosphoribosylamine--glycine ligase